MNTAAAPAVTSRSRRQRDLRKDRKNGTFATTEQTMAAYGTKRQRLLVQALSN